MTKNTLPAVIERLEHIKEDVSEIKKELKLLKEDYIERKFFRRTLIAVASATSAIVSFVMTHIITTIK